MKHFEADPSTFDANEILRPSNLLALGRDAARKTGLLDYSGEPNQLDTLRMLESVVESELARHNRTRTPWVPADYMPIDGEGKILHRVTDPDETPLLSPVAKAAMLTNLLTEDNLPSYHLVIANNFGRDGAWGTWVHQWTAEEDNHAYAMRAFLDLTQAISPAENEAARMEQMKQGYLVEKDPLHTLAYVTFQELATRVSHRQTGIASHNELADDMLARIAKDENLHMLFYRNLAQAALDIAPNQMMCAIRDEVMSFEMPGSNISGFKIMALEIAEAGIYDLRRHHDEIIMPVLKQWKVFERPFTGEGAAARDELAAYLVQLEKKAARFDDQRASGALRRVIDGLKARSNQS